MPENKQFAKKKLAFNFNTSINRKKIKKISGNKIFKLQIKRHLKIAISASTFCVQRFFVPLANEPKFYIAAHIFPRKNIPVQNENIPLVW